MHSEHLEDCAEKRHKTLADKQDEHSMSDAISRVATRRANVLRRLVELVLLTRNVGIVTRKNDRAQPLIEVLDPSFSFRDED